MINAHFKSEQKQFLQLDTEKILSAPLYILLGILKELFLESQIWTLSNKHFYLIEK